MLAICMDDFYQTRRNLLNWYHAFAEYIPLASIILHYGIVVNVTSECEDLHSFHIEYSIYMFIHIILIFGLHLLALTSDSIDPEMSARDWCIAGWKSGITVLQFFNFTYIRAKPYKCIFGDGYDPATATVMFWVIHLFTLVNVALLKNYLPNDVRSFEILSGPELLHSNAV